MVMPVTRVEIADHVEAAFSGEPIHKAELLEAARASGARLEVVKVLKRLPERDFRELRELWPQVPDLPVDG
jgi:Protein of unknown function (DUF2795)